MTSRESRKARITARRQDQILNAAMAVFSQRGFAAATVPEIAHQAGVATGTIYLYYSSKRDLFVALMRRLAQSGNVTENVENMSAAGLPATFKTILQNKVSIVKSADIFSIISLWSDILREPELKAQLTQQVFRPIRLRLEEFYRERMDTGEFRQLDPAVVARVVIGLMTGMIVLSIFEGDQKSADSLNRDVLTDEITDILLNGLAKEEEIRMGTERETI